MPRKRILNRQAFRRHFRHAPRMLNGARRPRPPNYLAIACSALREVIKIDQRLRPYMEEQRRMLELSLSHQEFEAAVRKVYGEPTAPLPPSQNCLFSSPASISQLLKDEEALAKTLLLMQKLESKMAKFR